MSDQVLKSNPRFQISIDSTSNKTVAALKRVCVSKKTARTVFSDCSAKNYWYCLGRFSPDVRDWMRGSSAFCFMRHRFTVRNLFWKDLVCCRASFTKVVTDEVLPRRLVKSWRHFSRRSNVEHLWTSVQTVHGEIFAEKISTWFFVMRFTQYRNADFQRHGVSLTSPGGMRVTLHDCGRCSWRACPWNATRKPRKEKEGTNAHRTKIALGALCPPITNKKIQRTWQWSELRVWEKKMGSFFVCIFVVRDGRILRIMCTSSSPQGRALAAPSAQRNLHYCCSISSGWRWSRLCDSPVMRLRAESKLRFQLIVL